MVVMMKTAARGDRATADRAPRRRRGSSLLMALMYVTLFGALAASMTAFSSATLEVAAGADRSTRAHAAAESGMSFLMLQFKLLTQNGKMPITASGTLSDALARTLFSGAGGLAPNLAAQLNGSANLQGRSVLYNAGTIQIPPIRMFNAIDDTCFAIQITQDAADPHILHLQSTGRCTGVQKTVQLDVVMEKKLKYAVYSNVAIQLGKNVRILGDIASAYNGTGKGPPVQMFSDFHNLPDLAGLDADLATLRTLLNAYDQRYANRLDVRDPASPAAVAAKNAGLSDRNGDGVIDDFDVFLKNVDSSRDAAVSPGEFVDPRTGKPYDSDLWSLIDNPLGPVSPNPWPGYNDGQLAGNDSYAKVSGSVKLAITQAQWQSAASGWSQWGDAGGTRFQDMFEGPVVPTDPTVTPVTFGYDFSGDLSVTPQNFDTSGLDSQIPATAATVAGSTISDGTLTAAMANGGTVTETFPSSATSGWQATYSRPVYKNLTFNNVRIPKGLNGKFINCTFNGYTSVKLNTTITKAGTSTTTSDPSQGMGWAQQMTKGTFSANTTLTSTNSVGYQQGNNLHFSGCNFNGVMSADVPSAYTHFANSWEFDGTTTMNNSVDQSVTIMAPNTNIEMGGFTNPSGNPSVLVGVVVAGNIDIRGSAVVDGSLIVPGNGAMNTTLGYFGSTDSGQAVPPQNQLPAAANGSYGHLFFRYNPDRGMPNGINIPITLTPRPTTYSQVAISTWNW